MVSKYKWLDLYEVTYWEPLATELGVSKVARGKSGFLTAYKKASGSNIGGFKSTESALKKLPDHWIKKRNAFIARHMAQVIKRGEKLFDNKGMPTRRHLALIMWAYSPHERKLKTL